MGQQAYKAGDWSNASYFYEKSYEFDQYVFFAERALFLDESDLNNLVQFSLNFKKISPHFVGDFNRYIYLYSEQLDLLFLKILLKKKIVYRLSFSWQLQNSKSLKRLKPFVSLSKHAALKKQNVDAFRFAHRTWFDKLTTNGETR